MFSHRIEGNTIYLAGELDESVARGLRQALAACPAGEVVVDLSGVRFLSSAALSELLLAARRQAGLGGRLRLASPTEEIRRLLELTRFDRLFTIDP
jgi:anti-anti-sigma factor